MITLRRSWLSLAGVTLVAGAALTQLGATCSPTVDAIDLGTLGGNWAIAYGVNTLGHVVGASATADGQGRAFLWRQRGRVQRLPWDPAPVGEMIDLGTLDGLPSSVAAAVNDRDQVVGRAYGIGPTGSFIARAFIWERGQLQALPTLPDLANSDVGDINVRGQAVGMLGSEDGLVGQAVVWDRGVVEPLTEIDGRTYSRATAINASGSIVGYGWSSTGSDSTPVIWRRGVPTTLAMLPGYDNGYPRDINNWGQAVGVSRVAEKDRCVLWDKGIMIDIGMLPGRDDCSATSINDRGEIVGYLALSGTGEITPFIWRRGVMTDLDAYVPPDSGWHLWFPMGNDSSAVVGRGENANGGLRAFKLQTRTVGPRH